MAKLTKDMEGQVEVSVRHFTNERLAWSLDHLNERGAHSAAMKKAVLAEAAHRLRFLDTLGETKEG